MTHRRTAGVVAVVLLASSVAVLLGLWQFSRHTDRAAQVALIQRNLGAEAVPLAQLLPTDDLDPGDVWRPVEVTGTWVPDSGVQLRNRPVADANASHALGLLRTDEDPARVLVVDRGWWRQTDVVPDGALALDAEPETLVVRLRAQEDLDDRPNPAGEVFRVHPASVLEQGGADPDAVGDALLTSAYGMVVEPRPTAPLGALPDPDQSLRSHLSYAFQWWFFALAIPVAAVVIQRRNAAEDAAAEAAEAGPDAANGTRSAPARPAPTTRPARRRRTDEDEEDAALDAAERAQRTPGV